jgi:hypothetical protein
MTLDPDAILTAVIFCMFFFGLGIVIYAFLEDWLDKREQKLNKNKQKLDKS